MTADREEKTTYQVRLPKKLLHEFLDAAKKRDDNAASLIRKFMRHYTSQQKVVPWARRGFSNDEFG